MHSLRHPRSLDRRQVLDQLVRQLRPACERFLQETLDYPANAHALESYRADPQLPQVLWHATLRLIYRVLAVLKAEASGSSRRQQVQRLFEAHRVIQFPHTSTGSRDQGTQLIWDPTNYSCLMESLLHLQDSGTLNEKASEVPYADLDIEDLGRIHEMLLEIEPGISVTPMSRLRRGRVEVVVPKAQAKPYRTGRSTKKLKACLELATESEELLASGVRWISDVEPGQFYLRTGLTRKGAGAYYTPQSFVGFLVQATLGPAVAERSSEHDPQPAAIAAIKVLDPAMGSGYFLSEACRFLGQKLLEACQSCVKLAAGDSKSQAALWRKRVLSLGNEGEEIWQKLLDESEPGGSIGNEPTSAASLCREVVARRCLYGVDRNPLSVEMARLTLALVVGVPRFSSSQLESHVLAGDSLAGPRFVDLQRLPGRSKADRSKTRLPPALWLGLERRFAQLATPAKSSNSRTAIRRQQLQRAMQVIAAAWSGGVQLGDELCDDATWLTLTKHFVQHGTLPERFDTLRMAGEPSSEKIIGSNWSDAPLHAMLARGLGIERVPAESGMLTALLDSGQCVPAVAFELAFPEVFLASGAGGNQPSATAPRSGFDVVLGNPPWEAVRPQRTEFFGNHDVACWAGHTRRERSAAEARLLRNPSIARRFTEYLERIEGVKRVFDRLYERQKVFVGGDLAGRYLDQYRVFLERKAQLVSRNGGRVGVIVPASFRANAGAVGLRKLYLLENQLEFLYTFRNTRQAFEVASGMQFCLLAARFDGSNEDCRKPDRSFEMASHLEDEDWLTSAERLLPVMRYPIGLLETVGGPHLTIVDFASEQELAITRRLVAGTLPLGEHPLFSGIPFQTNPAALNATTDAWRLQATTAVCQGDPRDPVLAEEIIRRGYAPLHEKGTFSRFQAREQTQPRYVVDLKKCEDRPDWLRQLQHFRLVGRSTIHASEPQKSVFALIPPGGLVSNSAVVEATPDKRPLESALVALTFLNSHVFNFLARQQVVLNLNLFILRNLRVPIEIPAADFLARAALRLSANDAGYAKISERLPRVDGMERLQLEADMNAAVASAYGTTLADYEEILRQGAPQLTLPERRRALQAYEKLLSHGLDSFVKKRAA